MPLYSLGPGCGIFDYSRRPTNRTLAAEGRGPRSLSRNGPQIKSEAALNGWLSEF